MPNTDSKNTVGWNTINWRKAERYVFKLQKRIYAASRHEDVKRVRKLQKILMSSWSNKVLAVRRVTQDNRGKKTAGVDGKKSLSPEARMKLVSELKLTCKSNPTRRVWIPKAVKDEKRPLGIPTIYDRALQGVVKAALEPEWEAKFEPNSYGFRPGRSCHDAVRQIKYAIQKQDKYVLDADIAKCFDRIEHSALLEKLGHKGKTRQQIKAWLKSGVVDQGIFTVTSEGSPQGGIISPLLANIALHGMENMLKEYVKTLNIRRNNPHRWMTREDKGNSLAIIRYADDFLIIHRDLDVIKRCRKLIAEWLKDMGLELKPSKTRIAHTLHAELSEDGQVGFNFLGYYIRQYPAGKYRSARNTKGKPLGFNTIIAPSKEACKKHQIKIKDVIKRHKKSHQAQLIKELDPIIRGWANYYSFSDANGVGEFSRQDYLMFQKLRAWARSRTGKWDKETIKKYWGKYGNNNWSFIANKGNKTPLRLTTHTEHGSSSTKYVKVKDDVSPFNGNTIYWSTRLGRSFDIPTKKATLLKGQRGICHWCCLHFREGDLIEIDHIIPKAIGGKNEYSNLQLLHGHCHDEKTRLDEQYIRDRNFDKYLDSINQELAKHDWFWNQEDILCIK